MNVIKAKKIRGGEYSLKPLYVNDVTEKYVSWLNDEKINSFLEVKYNTQSIPSVMSYVSSFYGEEVKYLWGIYENKYETHIGTISLYDINSHHKRAEIGMMIGDMTYWGKRASEEAIRMVLNFSFQNLNLHRVTGGCYSTNLGMIFTFKRLGFEREAILKDHYQIEQNYIDGYRWGLLSSEWKNREKN